MHKKTYGTLSASLFGLALMWTGPATAQDETLLLQDPDIHGDRVVFVYGGDIFTAHTDGSGVKRLTSDVARETDPAFSPDGNWIAFSANYNGNTDVYVMPSEGGQPTRLTYHASGDFVQDWTPDGRAVVFRSDRDVNERRGEHMFRVSVEGGLPENLGLPQAFEGVYSPDGDYFAYSLFRPAYSGASGWRNHRGGTTPPIWIADMDSLEVTEIPHENARDINPMWVGNTIYFISDRNEMGNLYSYTVGRDAVVRLTDQHQWDIVSAGTDGETIVYDAGGRLHAMDIASGDITTLSFHVTADMAEKRPGWRNAAVGFEGASLSTTGARVIATMRGDVWTLPTEKGDARNLTETNGVHERDGIWSADGQSLAYLSDTSGRWAIVFADQLGNATRTIELPDTSFYFLQDWSSDGQTIAYTDNHLNFYVMDVESGDSMRIDTAARRGFMSMQFSPDSQWLTYTKRLSNYMTSVRLYHVESGEVYDVSENMADAISPVFSRDGKYLYFAASTNFGHSTVTLDMSVDDRPVRRGIYAVVLAGDGSTPMPFESDEEEGSESEAEEGSEPDNNTVFDPEGIGQRIVSLPVAERNYGTLGVGKNGDLYFMDYEQAGASNPVPGSGPSGKIMKFSFEDRSAALFLDGVQNFTLSRDGSSMLVFYGGTRMSVFPTGATPSEPGKSINTSNLRVFVDPVVEWRKMFEESVWMEREYFYAPNMHGLDWDAVAAKHRPFIDHVATRADLNTVIRDFIAELEAGHNRVYGGEIPSPDSVPGGLLGADFTIENGRYQIAKIYTGEGWHPFLEAPLNVPGQNVSEGDYILAIDGVSLSGDDNIYRHLEGTVGKQVRLTVNDRPSMDGAREVVAKPVANEGALRTWDWIESRRQYVDRATDGRVGYAYMPNTAQAGFDYFNRYFFPQINKEGFILDERFNGGGQAANYVIEMLTRPYLGSWLDRDGQLFTTPAGSHYGPKAMLINYYSGSGGDFLPYSFRHVGLGPLIGTRTWGGLIGISINGSLMDGATLTVPYFRFIHPDGTFRIENEGVAPDIEVVQAPADMAAGRDPQLDAAIAHILEALESHEPTKVQTPPPYPTEPGQ